MTITVGIIIGVTLFFTICSIVLNRRPREQDEYALSAKPASWEKKGGTDLTSPMVGAAAVTDDPVDETPHFEPMPLPEGSRLRPANPPLARPIAPSMASAPTAASEADGPALSDEVVRGLEQIPPLPKGVQAVLRELDAAGSSAKSVGEIVESDPVVGAVVLRVVNSAASGMRGKVLTVKMAVAYLGFAQVRTLIMKLKVSQLFRAPASRTQCYDVDALWQHSMAVAHVAEQLAKRTGKADPDLASTLGLLHDIGKLAINCQFPHKVAQLWRPPGLIGAPEGVAAGESWLARERRLFGADHAFIGAFLAARWQLPEEIADGIRLHHPSSDVVLDTISEPVRRAVQVVHVANQLVKYRHVYCADMEIDTLDPLMLAELGLPADMEQIYDDKIERSIAAAAVMAKASSDDAAAGAAGMRASA